MILACRSKQRGEAALEEIKRVSLQVICFFHIKKKLGTLAVADKFNIHQNCASI